MTIRKFKDITPAFGNNCYIDESAVVVGDVQAGDDTSIWPFVAIRGDVNKIRIGQRTNIQDGSVLHVTRKSHTHPNGFPLSIGDDVTIGHKVMLHGCTLRNRILVGMGAVIMDGAEVEDDVFVGAGCLVPPGKVLKSGFLYVGSPAKQIRKLSEEEISFLRVSAENYIETKNEYLAEPAD